MVCGQKSALELFAPRFGELEQSLNMEGCIVEQGKTLGIVIDSELKFDGMVSHVVQAGHFQLNKLRNLRHILGKKEKLVLVKSLFLSRIDSCSFLYAGAEVKQIKKLQKTSERCSATYFQFTEG